MAGLHSALLVYLWLLLIPFQVTNSCRPMSVHIIESREENFVAIQNCSSTHDWITLCEYPKSDIEICLSNGELNIANIFHDNGTSLKLINCTERLEIISSCFKLSYWKPEFDIICQDELPVGFTCRNNSVQCNQGKLRIKEGTNWIEVCHNGRWLLIAGYGWKIFEAIVVCRQLGLPTTSVYPVTSYFTLNSSLQIVVVKCVGTEFKLFDCLYTEFVLTNSTSVELASVECSNQDTQDDKPRIELFVGGLVAGGVIGALSVLIPCVIRVILVRRPNTDSDRYVNQQVLLAEQDCGKQATLYSSILTIDKRIKQENTSDVESQSSVYESINDIVENQTSGYATIRASVGGVDFDDQQSFYSFDQNTRDSVYASIDELDAETQDGDEDLFLNYGQLTLKRNAAYTKHSQALTLLLSTTDTQQTALDQQDDNDSKEGSTDCNDEDDGNTNGSSDCEREGNAACSGEEDGNTVSNVEGERNTVCNNNKEGENTV